MQPDPAPEHVAAIYNAAWQVRFYCRPHQREQQAQAILLLGLTARQAFNSTEDFRALLYAIRDALAD